MTGFFFVPLAAPAAALGLFLFAAGCTVNPATGEHSFTAFMSPADELRIGREQHPKILVELITEKN